MAMNWYRILTGEYFTFSLDKGGSPPPAPPPIDPRVAIEAQARALPSVYSPQGSAVYNWSPGKAATPGTPGRFEGGSAGGVKWDQAQNKFVQQPNVGGTWIPGTEGTPETFGSLRQDITLSPEMQRQFDAKNRIAESLSGRVESSLPGLPDSFSFDGATDPTTNKRFMAQKALLDPVFAQDEERERQRMANQGIPEGSEAHRETFDDFGRRKAAAYEQASSNALDTGFGQSLTTRQQQLNEIAQILGGQQIAPSGGGNPLDVGGAFAQNQAGQNQQYQGQLAGYNAGVAGQNNLMSGLFGLGAAAIPLMSDIRLKKDITYTGELKPGIGTYSFRYKFEDAEAPLRFGVMAQEVKEVMPEAIIYRDDGMMLVDMWKVLNG